MKQFLALFVLLLSVASAHAQIEVKAPAVTHLPGEESLSLRERAERDFLMPVRRKQLTETAKATTDDNTAAPESDVTAHNSATPAATEEAHLAPVAITAAATPEEPAAPATVAAPVHVSHPVHHSSVHRSSAHRTASRRSSAHKTTSRTSSTRKAKTTHKASGRTTKKKTTSRTRR